MPDFATRTSDTRWWNNGSTLASPVPGIDGSTTGEPGEEDWPFPPAQSSPPFRPGSTPDCFGPADIKTRRDQETAPAPTPVVPTPPKYGDGLRCVGGTIKRVMIFCQPRIEPIPFDIFLNWIQEMRLRRLRAALGETEKNFKRR